MSRRPAPPATTLQRSAWLWAASLGGVGYLPLAPGTAGSLIGAGVSFPALALPWPVYVVVACALAAIAVWVTGRAARETGQADPPMIVLDEFVGMWCATLLLTASWYDLTAVFLLVRLFDIVKPSPVSRLEGLPGGLGIVLDDVAAGLLARATWWLLQANFDFL